MRGWWMIGVLALAGCAEHRGWNPNYQFGANAYGDYRTKREVALVTDTASPDRVPIALPVYSPTGAQITGQDPVPVPAVQGVRVITPAAP